MNAAELIAALQKVPGNTPIRVEADWGYVNVDIAYVDTATGAVVFTPYGATRLEELA